jgi:hypothetical protein
MFGTLLSNMAAAGTAAAAAAAATTVPLCRPVPSAGNALAASSPSKADEAGKPVSAHTLAQLKSPVVDKHRHSSIDGSSITGTVRIHVISI